MRASTQPRFSSSGVVVPAGLTASRHFFAHGREKFLQVCLRAGALDAVALYQASKPGAKVRDGFRVVFGEGLQQQGECQFAGHGRVGHELKWVVQGGSFRGWVSGLAIRSLARLRASAFFEGGTAPLSM